MDIEGDFRTRIYYVYQNCANILQQVKYDLNQLIYWESEIIHNAINCTIILSEASDSQIIKTPVWTFVILAQTFRIFVTVPEIRNAIITIAKAFIKHFRKRGSMAEYSSNYYSLPQLSAAFSTWSSYDYEYHDILLKATEITARVINYLHKDGNLCYFMPSLPQVLQSYGNWRDKIMDFSPIKDAVVNIATTYEQYSGSMKPLIKKRKGMWLAIVIEELSRWFRFHRKLMIYREAAQRIAKFFNTEDIVTESRTMNVEVLITFLKGFNVWYIANISGEPIRQASLNILNAITRFQLRNFIITQHYLLTFIECLNKMFRDDETEIIRHAFLTIVSVINDEKYRNILRAIPPKKLTHLAVLLTRYSQISGLFDDLRGAIFTIADVISSSSSSPDYKCNEFDFGVLCNLLQALCYWRDEDKEINSIQRAIIYISEIFVLNHNNVEERSTEAAAAATAYNVGDEARSVYPQTIVENFGNDQDITTYNIGDEIYYIYPQPNVMNYGNDQTTVVYYNVGDEAHSVYPQTNVENFGTAQNTTSYNVGDDTHAMYPQTFNATHFEHSQNTTADDFADSQTNVTNFENAQSTIAYSVGDEAYYEYAQTDGTYFGNAPSTNDYSCQDAAYTIQHNPMNYVSDENAEIVQTPQPNFSDKSNILYGKFTANDEYITTPDADCFISLDTETMSELQLNESLNFPRVNYKNCASSSSDSKLDKNFNAFNVSPSVGAESFTPSNIAYFACRLSTWSNCEFEASLFSAMNVIANIILNNSDSQATDLSLYEDQSINLLVYAFTKWKQDNNIIKKAVLAIIEALEWVYSSGKLINFSPKILASLAKHFSKWHQYHKDNAFLSIATKLAKTIESRDKQNLMQNHKSSDLVRLATAFSSFNGMEVSHNPFNEAIVVIARTFIKDVSTVNENTCSLKPRYQRKLTYAFYRLRKIIEDDTILLSLVSIAYMVVLEFENNELIQYSLMDLAILSDAFRKWTREACMLSSTTAIAKAIIKRGMYNLPFHLHSFSLLTRAFSTWRDSDEKESFQTATIIIAKIITTQFESGLELYHPEELTPLATSYSKWLEHSMEANLKEALKAVSRNISMQFEANALKEYTFEELGKLSQAFCNVEETSECVIDISTIIVHYYENVDSSQKFSKKILFNLINAFIKCFNNGNQSAISLLQATCQLILTAHKNDDNFKYVRDNIQKHELDNMLDFDKSDIELNIVSSVIRLAVEEMF